MNVEKAIWSAYVDNPCRLYSIRELAISLNKSYSLVHKHMSRLLVEKKMFSKTMGKSILCYPNYTNSSTLLFMGIAEANYTFELANENSSIQNLYSFFSNQVFTGVLSVFISEDDLIIILADDLYKKEVEKVLHSTTLKKSTHFILPKDLNSKTSILVNKSLVLFGFEQFHTLIRNNYSKFAGEFNLVKLHE